LLYCAQQDAKPENKIVLYADDTSVAPSNPSYQDFNITNKKVFVDTNELFKIRLTVIKSRKNSLSLKFKTKKNWKII
jgi:hypothetical protein